MAFPTLSTDPLIQSYQEDGEDPTISTGMEAGYEQTWARFTRDRPKFHLSYGDLTDADYALLTAHQTAVRVGAVIFDWTHNVTAVTYQMRYKGRIKFGYNQVSSCHTAEFDLQGA
jgi:hypothetical protein